MVKKKSHKFSLMEGLRLLGCIFLSLAMGIIGALFTRTGPGSWYSGLAKPPFNPPNWIFGPVWTALYILMGIAFYLALKNNVGFRGKRLFLTQLILNLLWTIIFFSMHSILLAAIEILILWIYILLTIIEFREFSLASAYLMLPYLLWVTFASILTFTIYAIN